MYVGVTNMIPQHTCQPKLYSFHKYLLSTYNMPDVVLSTGDVAVGSFMGDMK